MDRKEIAQKAFTYHDQGFHCAEAVSLAICESFAPERLKDLPRAASAFGGGVGASHAEMCGALAGGVLALGLVWGRETPGADWGQTARAASELRARFLARCGSTNCQEILDMFGPQENMMQCKRLSGDTAGMLADILLRAE